MLKLRRQYRLSCKTGGLQDGDAGALISQRSSTLVPTSNLRQRSEVPYELAQITILSGGALDVCIVRTGQSGTGSGGS